MIIDTMTKFEVMRTLRKEFDDKVLPYYYKRILPRLKAAIQQRCQREKTTINLGWEAITTTQQNVFKILKRGDANGDKPLFVCEFRWNGKLCYGNFFPEKHVVVYQAHCLQRYAERVLRTDKIVSEVFYNYLLKKQSSAYNITLPTPTHMYSQYFGLANALFLGDFDKKNPKEPYLWLNTCISYNEARYSQSRIMKSLHELQTFVEQEHYDYSRIENENHLKSFIKRFKDSPEKVDVLKKFLTQKFLLWKLYLSYNFPFTELFIEEINKTLAYLEKYMLQFNIQPKSLSPFSKQHGIAWKGEIDYRG